MVPEGWMSKDEEDPNVPEGWKNKIPNNLENNKNLRPRLNEIVDYMVKGVRRTGKVVRVKKKTGSNKNRCWIKDNANETNYDFVKEVDNWKVLKNETFSKDTKKTKSTVSEDNEEIGLNYMKNVFAVTNSPSRLENENEIFVTQISKKFHDHPQIIEAKKEELRRWQEYGAVEQVNQGMEMNVLSSRWVVSEKGDDEVKARLVVRGFEEEI